MLRKLNPFGPRVPEGLKRLYARVEQTVLDRPKTGGLTDYGETGTTGTSADKFTFAPESEANLVTSATGVGDWHLPVLDLDIPHKLVPSSTEGHSHLYIDVPVRWSDYVELLQLLERIGILEYGYVGASIAKGATMVRKPEIRKPNYQQYAQTGSGLSSGFGGGLRNDDPIGF